MGIKTDPDASAGRSRSPLRPSAPGISTPRTSAGAAPGASAARSVKSEFGGASATPSAATGPAKARTYRDIPLYSMDGGGWTTHTMQFASHVAVDPGDPNHFAAPIKLNRKFPPRARIPAPQPGDPVTTERGRKMAGLDGQPLVWPDVGDADAMAAARAAIAADDAKASGGQDDSLIAPSGRSKRPTTAGRRVREIHHSSAHARKTRQEEFFPWVLEDFETGEAWESGRTPDPRSKDALKAWLAYVEEHGSAPPPSEAQAKAQAKAQANEGRGATAAGRGHAPWVGQLEGDEGASHHLLFALDHAGSGAFKVIPVRKHYKFRQKPRHSTLTPDEVEEVFAKQSGGGARTQSLLMQRARERTRAVQGAAGAGGIATTAKLDPDDAQWARGLGVALPGVTGSGGRGRSTGTAAVRQRVWSAYERTQAHRSEAAVMRAGREERDGDEVDFTEDFADDDERMDMLDRDKEDDAEAREVESRLKRDMLRAEGQGGDVQDEEAEDDDEQRQLTGTGRQMKKIMRALGQREGNEAYDSEDENPYASAEDDDDLDDLAVTNPEKALEQAREERMRREREEAQRQKERERLEARANVSSTSRGSTPAPGQGHGTNRSGTPRAGTPAASGNASRSGSPRPGSRGASPAASLPVGSGHVAAAQRAASPARSTGGRPSSPPPASTGSGKRKGDKPDDGEDEASKRRKTQGVTQAQVEAELMDMLRAGGPVTTHDVVRRFKALARDPDEKKKLGAAVKKVAVAAPDPRNPGKNVLVLRDGL